MQKNILETIVGFLVIVIAAAFFYEAYQTTQVSYKEGGYEIEARFERVDGLNMGGDVKIGGIKVGKVIAMQLDPKNFQAVVSFKIKNGINIPTDSTAAIVSSGLLGEKYISLLPGAESTCLQNKEKLQFTQSSVNLEGLLGKFMFNSTSGANDGEQKAK